MDMMAKLLDEFRRGIINERQYLSLINHIADMEDHAHIVATQREIEKLSSMNQLYAITPEEVVLEKERKKEILMVVNSLREILGDKRWEILCLYVIDRMTQEQIAKRLCITQEAITQRLQTIFKKIQKNLIFLPFSTVYIEGLLQPPQSTLEAKSPESVGYPYEFLEKVGVGGRWVITRRGVKKWETCIECHLPNYFEESFCDKNTACTLCFDEVGVLKCKRSRDNASTK